MSLMRVLRDEIFGASIGEFVAGTVAPLLLALALGIGIGIGVSGSAKPPQVTVNPTVVERDNEALPLIKRLQERIERLESRRNAGEMGQAP